MMAIGSALRSGAYTLLLVSALAGTSATEAQELSMGNVNPPKHGTSQASQQFIDKLAELTGGKIKITHHHSGALGGEREVAQQIQLGAVDFGPITTAPLSTLIPEMSVFQLPYIFRDYDHVFKALDGSDTITKYYEAVLDKKGLKLIGFIAAGYRGIYGHGAINSLADVKGKKVRVQEDKILVATFKALGMISTPIAFPEVATALQTQGDRLRRGRGQHVLPQQVLRHRQVRRRRAPHPSGRGAHHVEGRMAEAGCRRPEGDHGRLGACPRVQPQVHPRRGQVRSRTRCARRASPSPSPMPRRSGRPRRASTRSSTRRRPARTQEDGRLHPEHQVALHGLKIATERAARRDAAPGAPTTCSAMSAA